MIKVSVIVPIHNSAPYLKECLESILSQGIEEMEVIAINDCSTDKSGSELDRISKSDRRIRAVHLEKNVGQGFARNKGLDLAKGKWIAFLDSDDIMQENSLKHLIKEAETYKSEIIIGRTIVQYEKTENIFISREYQNTKYIDFNVSNTSLNNCNALINLTTFSAVVYRRDFLENSKIRFLRRNQEDQDFVLNVFLEAKKISMRQDIPFVIYRRRSSLKSVSTTQSGWSNGRLENLIEQMENVIKLLSEKKYKLNERSYLQKRRYSFYFGYLVNDTLPSIFRDKEFKVSDKLLETITKIFTMMNFSQSGLDFQAHSLSGQQELIENGYYNLVLDLILESRWNEVRNLIVHKWLDINDVARMSATKNLNASTLDNLSFFLKNSVNPINPRKNPIARMVPYSVDEVIIHISPLSDSSILIKDFLEQYQDTLMSNGVMYPLINTTEGFRYGKVRSTGQYRIATAIKNQNQSFIQKIHNEIELRNNIKKVILSEESFYSSFQEEEIKRLRNALGGVNTKIIIYLERQDLFLENYFSLSIFGGDPKEHRNFKEFVSAREYDGSLNYFEKIEKWSKIFGSENIIIRPLDKIRKKSSVINDFCNHTNIGAIGSYERNQEYSSRINSLNKNDLNLLRQLNKLNFNNKDQGYRPFLESFLDKFGTENPNHISWCTTEERERLINKYLDSNNKIANKYLRKESLFKESAKKLVSQKEIKQEEINESSLEEALKLYQFFSSKGANQNKRIEHSKFKLHETIKATSQLSFEDLYEKGCYEFESKNFDKAYEFLLSAYEKNTNHKKLKLLIAETLLHLDRKKLALYYFLEAHELPENQRKVIKQFFGMSHRIINKFRNIENELVSFKKK